MALCQYFGILGSCLSFLDSRQFLLVTTNQKRAAGFYHLQNGAVIFTYSPSSKCRSCGSYVIVIRIATRIHNAFSLNYFHGCITQTNRKTRTTPLFTVVLYSVSWVMKLEVNQN